MATAREKPGRKASVPAGIGGPSSGTARRGSPGGLSWVRARSNSGGQSPAEEEDEDEDEDHGDPLVPKTPVASSSRRNSVASSTGSMTYGMPAMEEAYLEPPRLSRRATITSSETHEVLAQLHAVAHQEHSARYSLALLDGHDDIGVGDDDDNISEILKRHKMKKKQVGARSKLLALSVAMVCAGCACQASVERMSDADKGCGDLVSAAELGFGLMISSPAAAGICQRRRAERGAVVPLWTHAGLAALGVACSMLLNAALGSQLPTIVTITLKNGNLVANALVGAVVLRKRYTRAQLASIFAVTLGLVLTAFAKTGESTKEPPTPTPTRRPWGWGSNTKVAPPGAAPSSNMMWNAEALVAVGCLSGALIARALQGAVQERALQGTASPPSATEMLFFRNAFGLPIFLLRARHVLSHADLWRARGGVGGLPFPSIWLLLVADLVFDYACKVLMTDIVASAGALHATLVLTVQKFAAFLVSVVLLNPTLRRAPQLWLGAAMVLAGTTAYSTVAKPKTTKRD